MDTPRPSPRTNRTRRVPRPVRVGASRFHDAAGISDEAVAALINGVGVHVLVDLDYNKERLAVLALHPAPAAAAFLAHPGTSGAPFVDFAVFDQVRRPCAPRCAHLLSRFTRNSSAAGLPVGSAA